MNDFNLNLDFDLKKNKSNVIKVIGVGGGGGNAVNYMYEKGINNVDFVVVNTDAQDLSKSPIPIKIQIGKSLTEGLGAGANPQIGEKAAKEDIEAIKSVLKNNTKMIFITAGMGGGTGTGAAPVIAKLAKEMGILTVGIVTSPFAYEGRKRNLYAQKGIENLREFVDSLIIINNNKMREIYGNLAYKQAFAKSDEVLASAATSIAEVITRNYTVNIDFKDVNTVLENSGTAIMGSATASGENRANDVIVNALDSPLLNDNKITGAQNVLLLIETGTGENEITVDEISEINDFIQKEAGNNADVIMGIGEDDNLGDAISVTIVATGFNENQQDLIANAEPEKIVHILKDENESQIVIDDHLEPISNDIPETIPSCENDIPETISQPDNNNKVIIDSVEQAPYKEPRVILVKGNPTKQPEDNIAIAEKEASEDDGIIFRVDEEPKNEEIDVVEDMTEMPIEEALKMMKKRKQNLKKYVSPLSNNDSNEDIPAFKKQGIDVDLKPKSSENIHRIEMDPDGFGFKISDSNLFLNDNVD